MSVLRLPWRLCANLTAPALLPALFAGALALFGSPRLAVAQPRIVRFGQDPAGATLYEPFDIGVRVRNPVVTNPFTDVSIVATFTPDGGAPIAVHGFCDSTDGTFFRVRFCPTVIRGHSVHISYTDRAGTVTYDDSFPVAWGPSKGFIRVDSQLPNRFVQERTRETWFHQGCTSLVFTLASDAEAQRFVDRMTSYGFNRCRIVLAGGIRYPFNDREMNPFVGYDFTRFDLAYWRTMENRLRYMKDKRMVADLIFLIEWGTFIYRFIDRNSITDAEWRYFRYAIDRFAAFTNVTWNLGNEYGEYHSPSWANLMGARIKTYDPYDHLLTVHPSNSDFRHGSSAWANTIDLQAYAGGTAVTVRTLWNVLRTAISSYFPFRKPVVDDEYGYEGPYPGDVVRKSHWVNVFAGGYATYGAFEAVTIRADDPYLVGGEVVTGQLPHVLEFVESTPFHLLQPNDAIVLGSDHPVFCRALRGHEYAVYLPDGGNVSIDLTVLRGASLPLEWIRPDTGDHVPAGDTAGLTIFAGAPPFPGDALLHIGGTARNERVAFDFSDRSDALTFQPGGGRWVSMGGAYVQADGSRPLAWTWIRGKLYRDVVINSDLQILGGTGHRAGVVLRAEDPSARLGTADSLFVTFENGGTVAVDEVIGGVSTRLATRTTATWNPTSFNHVQIGLRGSQLGVFVNGAHVLGTTTQNPHPADGFVALLTEGAQVGFDNVRLRPILFRDFEDGSTRDLQPIDGTWTTFAARLEQADPSGGGMAIGNSAYARFQMHFSVKLASPDAGDGAGVAFRTQTPQEGLLRSGYFLRYDGTRDVQFFKVMPGPIVQLLAWYQDTGNVLRPGGWNRFEVHAGFAVFSVRCNGVELFNVRDPDGRWPIGYVQLRDLAGQTLFDNLSLVGLD